MFLSTFNFALRCVKTSNFSNYSRQLCGKCLATVQIKWLSYHRNLLFNAQSKPSHSGDIIASRFYSKFNDDAKSIQRYPEFKEVRDKNKETFLEMVRLYDKNYSSRKGLIDFIYAALKEMENFGVHNDLETYKEILDLMPRGKYVPTNMYQVMLMHYPREQECITFLLAQMEYFGVMPDVEMGSMIRNIFGSSSSPTRKYLRMMYWMPKFKNRSPWPLPSPISNEPFTLGKLAVERITSVDLQTEISVYRTEEVEASVDKTWIVSGMSPTQKALLREHNPGKPVIVEVGDHVWLRQTRVNYFVLKSEDNQIVFEDEEPLDVILNVQRRYLNPDYKPPKKPSVHEQEDGTIYAVCVTGTSSKDSLLSWIRLLQENGNPVLEDLAVLFKFKRMSDKPATLEKELTT